ncbi:MAG: DNA polymerase III subunit chi [Pseudomonas sp.]|uniref:DNA polymerase III subunit chi n=1 Tax=Pseudomonas sp. TaxID=306 RepID=UPI003391D959
MDTPKPPHKPAHLLDDLESIREFLVGDVKAEPPLLTDSVDLDSIPLLSEVVSPGTLPPAPRPAAPPAAATPPAYPASIADLSASELRTRSTQVELARLNTELRAAAQLLLQDVIDDFVPQIEAELKRRLDARLDRLLAQRKP